MKKRKRNRKPSTLMKAPKIQNYWVKCHPNASSKKQKLIKCKTRKFNEHLKKQRTKKKKEKEKG